MNNGYNSVLKQTTHPTKKWTEDLNTYFSKKDIQMANGHMKRCSISLIVREMQIKSTMRHQFTLARIIILKSMNSKCWKVCGEKGTLLHCWDCKLMQPLRKTAWRFLKKIKIQLPYDPVIPFLGIYLEKRKTLTGKDISTTMFIAALFIILNMEATQVSINRQLAWKDMVCVYTYICVHA